MYESHFGLTAKPFSIVPNPELLFLGKNHENALTYLEYGLNEKVGFILLTGEIGAGKTTLIRYMLNQIEQQMDIAVIFNTNFSTDQLFQRILSEFEIPWDTTDKERHLELLYQFLIGRYAQQRHVLLIIDEAQNLSTEALEDIRMLSNLQTDDQILLQIMLVGQPELKNRLNSADFRQLAQRIAVNYHITPLDEDQTRSYISYRIQKAGGATDLFSSEAISKIYEHSGGIPRSINLMCDTALVYGFADNLERIDGGVVDRVIKDKVCMAFSKEKPPGKTVKRTVTTAAGPGIMERLFSLEESLADLRRQHETFSHEVKNDLVLKYQQLLIAEKKRFDRLVENYTRLLQTDRHSQTARQRRGDGSSAISQSKRKKEGTKFAHLLKMVESKKDVNEE